jgi:hypothetical protein
MGKMRKCCFPSGESGAGCEERGFSAKIRFSPVLPSRLGDFARVKERAGNIRPFGKLRVTKQSYFSLKSRYFPIVDGLSCGCEGSGERVFSSKRRVSQSKIVCLLTSVFWLLPKKIV